MHFYAMSYPALLALPIGVFWGLARNIDRLRADEDLRQLSVIGAAIAGGDDFVEGLKEQRGRIVTAERKSGFDREGFKRLRVMMGATR